MLCLCLNMAAQPWLCQHSDASQRKQASNQAKASKQRKEGKEEEEHRGYGSRPALDTCMQDLRHARPQQVPTKLLSAAD